MPLPQLRINKQITVRENQSIEKYLQQVQATPLLTIEEEIEYTKLIKQGQAAEETLKEKKREVYKIVRESKKTDSPSAKRKATNASRRLKKAEVKIKEIIAKANRAKDKIISGNLRFVISVAKQYQNRGLSINDLIANGNIGLIKAAGRFDETRGFKFISYAVWWLRQSILQAINESSLIRKPGSLTSKENSIYKTYKILVKKLERNPTAQEIAAELDIPVDTVFAIQKANIKPISIDAPFKQGEENTLIDVLQNDKADMPEEQLMHDALHEDISRMIDKLEKREQKVIRWYFGIRQNGGFSKTLEDIGKKLGLTRERVRQIREQGIKKLRKLFFKKNKLEKKPVKLGRAL